MISVSSLYVVAIVWPVLSLFAVALWIWVKYPAIEEDFSAEELDAPSTSGCTDCDASASKYCSYECYCCDMEKN